MAAPIVDLRAFAQSIYLVLKNRYFDDIEDDDGAVFVNQIIDWTNMFLDELETEVGPDGEPVDWWFARESGSALGTATLGAASISTPSGVDRLITDEQRYVQVKQDSSVISNWQVVHPKDITSRTDRVSADMCAMVGQNIVFSRPFNDNESTGAIVGDVILSLPRLSLTNTKLLTTVKPALLLKLGVAKNAILPDIVQGKLSPNYAQKFQDLLTGAIARSNATSVAATVNREDYSRVRGV